MVGAVFWALRHCRATLEKFFKKCNIPIEVCSNSFTTVSIVFLLAARFDRQCHALQRRRSAGDGRANLLCSDKQAVRIAKTICQTHGRFAVRLKFGQSRTMWARCTRMQLRSLLLCFLQVNIPAFAGPTGSYAVSLCNRSACAETLACRSSSG